MFSTAVLTLNFDVDLDLSKDAEHPCQFHENQTLCFRKPIKQRTIKHSRLQYTLLVQAIIVCTVIQTVML